MSFGWAGQILKIDLSNRRSDTDSIEQYARSFIGGRGVSDKIIFEEVTRELSQFDPANIICFGPGVLTGTPSAGSSRLKVSAIGEGGFLRHAGLGGDIPRTIKLAGYDLITVQGRAEEPLYIYICNDQVQFRKASHLWGKDVYESQAIIRDEIGKSVDVMCIGPAGEKAVAFGSIHTGWGSAAGLGGLGGVMGSKNLKAIAVTGTRDIHIAKMTEFLEAAEQQRVSFANSEAAIQDMRLGQGWRLAYKWTTYGIGSKGNFESVPGLNDLVIPPMDDFANKYGVAPLVCGSCPVSHNYRYDVPGIGKGGAKCTGLHSVTATLWNKDWTLGFQAYNLINRYGMDVMAATSIIALLMELYAKGIISSKDTDGIPMVRGDKNAIINIIHKLGRQEGIGKLFKDGIVEGAKKLGRDCEQFVMAVKGQALQPYTFRVNKQFALATATNTKDMIDAVNIIAYGWQEAATPEIKQEYEKLAEKEYGVKETAFPYSYKGAAWPTAIEEGKVALGDMLGVCKWLITWFMTSSFEVPAKLFSLATGVSMTEDDLLFAAQKVITLERAINAIKGMRRKDDILPERFFSEPEPGGPYKGEKLEKGDFQSMLDAYYFLRGYNSDGVPTEETFHKYGLVKEWGKFAKNCSSEQKIPQKGNRQEPPQ